MFSLQGGLSSVLQADFGIPVLWDDSTIKWWCHIIKIHELDNCASSTTYTLLIVRYCRKQGRRRTSHILRLGRLRVTANDLWRRVPIVG